MSNYHSVSFEDGSGIGAGDDRTAGTFGPEGDGYGIGEAGAGIYEEFGMGRADGEGVLNNQGWLNLTDPDKGGQDGFGTGYARGAGLGTGDGGMEKGYEADRNPMTVPWGTSAEKYRAQVETQPLPDSVNIEEKTLITHVTLNLTRAEE